uniref:Proline--tRNA ligase n=1 Tax=Zeugodacus cucurbitae TaxID=28588 RepID=A0A0A1WHJ6_ZEUCU
MPRISVRKDIFAISPVSPLISLAEENKPTSEERNTKSKSNPTYINPYGRHFEVTKSNEFKSLRNFGLWYKPPEDDESVLDNLTPPNVRQLELYNTSLIAESATPAEDCVTTTDVFVEEARQNEISAEECVVDIQKCVTAVAEDVSQAKGQDYSEIVKIPEKIIIGPNGTSISLAEYKSIEWDAVSYTIRDLLLYVFDRNTLLTNTLYGRPSKKGKLDPRKVADISYFVRQNVKCSEGEVRRAIVQRLGMFHNREREKERTKRRKLFI